ncbi:MAG: hypothetical protein RLZ12_985 [Bacillota bacterium]|jgi:hypothetical protein
MNMYSKAILFCYCLLCYASITIGAESSSIELINPAIEQSSATRTNTPEITTTTERPASAESVLPKPQITVSLSWKTTTPESKTTLNDSETVTAIKDHMKKEEKTKLARTTHNPQSENALPSSPSYSRPKIKIHFLSYSRLPPSCPYTTTIRPVKKGMFSTDKITKPESLTTIQNEIVSTKVLSKPPQEETKVVIKI